MRKFASDGLSINPGTSCTSLDLSETFLFPEDAASLPDLSN
jgi:hypothetical protein